MARSTRRARACLALVTLLTMAASASAADAPAPAPAGPPAISVYGALPGWSDAAISPSGKFVAVLGSDGGERVIYLLTAKRELIARIPAGKGKLRSIDWAGDDYVLIAFSNTAALGPDFTTDKAELGSTIVLPLKTGKPWVVFAHDSEISGGIRGNYGVAQHDGHWYGYFSAITLDLRGDGTRALPLVWAPDLYEVDLATARLHLIGRKSSDANIDRAWLIDGRGKVAAVMDLFENVGKWQIRNDHYALLAEGHDKLARVDMLGFTTDGQGVIYSQRDADNIKQWYSVPLAGGASAELLSGVSVKRSFWDADRRFIGYLGESSSDSHFFDPHQDKVYAATVKAFPGARVSLVSNSTDFTKLVVSVSGPRDPDTLWLVNAAEHRADMLDSGWDIAPEAVGPMKMITYKAADGQEIEAQLTLPPGRPAKALPAVILPHGGPAAHDVFGFDWWAQAYASRGYAVLQPNFRGSTGYGTALEDAGHGEWGRKMQTDLSDGLGELVRQGIVDPKRVCIVGASYGGYAALAGVTVQHGIYACAVAVAGIGDLQRMVDDDATASGDNDLTVRWLRTDVGRGSDIKAVSPIRFVDSVTVPVLLIHGKDDTVVPYHQSKAMADALRHAGKQVEFVTLPGEDHWLSQSATRQQMLEAAVGFVMRAVPPDPAPGGAASVATH